MRRVGKVPVQLLCFLLLVVLSTAVARVATGSFADSGPVLSATSHTAVPGQRINLRISGFRSGELIVLSWDGRGLAGTDTANAQGVVSNSYAYIPYSTKGGRHTLLATGKSSGRKAALIILVPAPALHGVPLVVTPGQRFPIQGTYFGAGETIAFYWDGALLPTWHARVDALGSFKGSYGHVPGAAAVGRHVLLARGAITGRSAQVRVMVVAHGAVSQPSSTPVPTVVPSPTNTPPVVAQAAQPGSNPVKAENALPGTSDWTITKPATSSHLIEGYADKVSVNIGGQIGLYVNASPATLYNLDVFRMGWYKGAGARRLLRVSNLSGAAQPACPLEPTRGLVQCNWNRSYTLGVPSAWTSGVYLARLTRTDGYQSYIIFVVRDDAGSSALLFQTSVATYQAYNAWGGESLYGSSDTTGEIGTAGHAFAVSFDRPYDRGYGSGDFLFWEYPMVRWLEMNGYDVSYTTDIDTDFSVDSLLRHKAFLSVGHDEYWSRNMYDHVEYARDRGVSLGFFGGNIDFWQVRFESSANGSDRVMICYKDKTLDPEYGQHNDLVTVKWRDPLLNRPEQSLIGQMWESWFHPPTSFALRPINTNLWPYAGTGLHDGADVQGMVGYEYDRVFSDVPTAPGLQILASSPVVNVNGTPSVSNVTLYTASSGARVFSAGSIQWSWGLDDEALEVGLNDWSMHHTANYAIRRMTANILDNFIAGH
jgi:hypothetical protein